MSISNETEQMEGENALVPNINGSYRVCFILSLWNLFTDLDILCEKGFNTTLFQTEVIKD